MTINTTRRALIQGAPAAAAVIALPNVAFAGSGQWEAAKAKYIAAHAELISRIDVVGEAEKVAASFRGAAPKPVEITYQVEGFTTDNGLVIMKPHQSKFELTVHNYRGPSVPSELERHPEYLSFQRAADKWANDPAHLAAQRAEREADEYCREGHNIENEAYLALLAAPVHSLGQVREKLSFCRAYDMQDDDRRRDLLKAIDRDMSQLP